MAIQEGQKFGNYKVLSRLGVGGMGAVYLAEHPLIGKKVALKAIHPEFAHNKEVVQRFFNEARAVNKIGNEHIVEIHDFGQSPDGDHFFIMEYLEGPTLAEVLQTEGVVHPQRALHIGAQLAAGLAAAHSCGIIHRDLKPDNIMLVQRLGDKDFVKILDFGLAKMFADAGAKLTAQGVVLGTPQYMAPEACESKQDIDHRSDIYALGVLLFQMLCGQVPFDGNSMGEILVKHVSQPPPAPRGFNPAIPPSVEQIILRCLAKKKDDRFATMKDLRAALLDSDRYLASSPPVMPSASSPQAKTVFGKSQQLQVQQPPPGAAPPGAATVAPDNPQAVHHNGLVQGAPLLPAGGAEPAKTVMLGEGQPLPLKPPPPSIVNAPLAGTAPANAKTAFIDGGVGPLHGAATQPSNGAGGVPAAGAAAKTAFLASGAVSFGDAPAMPKRTISAVPDMNPPAPPVNATMVIGTPEGYSDKPPGKAWPMVVGLLCVAGVVGAAVALLIWPGFLNNKKTDDGDQSAAASGDAGGVKNKSKPAPVAQKGVSDSLASKQAVDAGVAVDKKPAKVTIRFNTVPAGAKVYDQSNALLGKTPCDLTFPNDGKPRVVTLKHPRAKTRKKTIIATADLDLTVDMELKRRRRRYRHRRRRPKSKLPDRKPPSKNVGDGVQDPDF